MLSPKKMKYRKQQRGKMKGVSSRGNTLEYGDYGLQALQEGWIKANQIEAARIAISKGVKRGGKIWIRMFPDKPVSKKPAETRMGKGKGETAFWAAVVRPGRIMYELRGVGRELALKSLTSAAHKLPIKTKIVTRGHYEKT